MKHKKTGLIGKVIKTVLSVILSIVCIVMLFAVNVMLPNVNRIANSILGGISKTIDNSNVNASDLDLEYYKADYKDAEELKHAKEELITKISDEGSVLLKNHQNALPIGKDEKFSFVSANSDISVGGGMAGGGTSLKKIFEDENLAVNETLWDFYTEGEGKKYGLASGSISFGDAEDFRINEAPLSLLKEKGVLDSLNGTIPVYILKRVAGEGRDMPRSMYNHAVSQEDKQRTYIEPDTAELEILAYLNENFDNVVLVVNSNAALELGWVSQYPHIRSIIYAPDGLGSLPKLLTGEVNPSGRTVDSFAVDALQSPAAKNFGDYQFVTSTGEFTKYNYVSYQEGIYVGYRYYETRYEDAVLQQGNTAGYKYEEDVVYPFGFGLSYTDFHWSDQKTEWDGDVATVSIDVKNIGDVAGKDVVQVYVQSPYTEYDRKNGIEKAAVELVGYAKTKLLEPNEKETVTISFNKEQLKAFDASEAGTYIFDAGEYYITAAKDAHHAINNILLAKGVEEGKLVNIEGTQAKATSDLVTKYVPENTEVDVTTYAKDSLTQQMIQPQLADAQGDVTYLSRQDWNSTFPVHDGKASEQISTWGNEINGKDADGNAASYTFVKEISNENLAKLDSFDSGNPHLNESFDDEIVFGAENGLKLIDMRGLAFDDPQWDALLDQLKEEEYYEIIAQSGYGIPEIKSIEKPFNIDADTASGLIYGGTQSMMSARSLPNPMTLAQTWNKDLAYDYGKVIGNDALLGSADGWYAPSMNIHRTPFSGRNGEYYSEDPFVSAEMATREVTAVAEKGVYAYIKHFAFNDQENHRGDRQGQFSIATFLNEQSAREIYLAPFEAVMKAGNVELNYIAKQSDGSYQNEKGSIPAAQAIMSSFNRVGYTWTGGSYHLITEIVRNEWGFNGMIITDNANTGVFMSANQMIEAGADMKLTYDKKAALFNWDTSDAKTYHYARQAMHRVLYTVANSKVMNHAMSGSKIKTNMFLTTKIQIAVNLVAPILIILMGIMTVRRFRKSKQSV